MLLITAFVITAFVGMLGLGLYTMEIEDHYGDAQELYYKSKTGDIIINRNTSEFGIVEKSWKRINIRTSTKDSTALYNWIYQNGKETTVEIYRPKSQFKLLEETSLSELKNMIDKSEMVLVIRN